MRLATDRISSDGRRDVALASSIWILQRIHDIADSSGVPFLNSAVGLALSILQTMSDARDNMATCQDLAAYAAEVVLTIHDAMKGVDSVSPETLKHVVDFEGSLRGIKTDLEFLGKKSLWYQMLCQVRIAGRIKLHRQNLERALSLFGVKMTMAVETKVSASLGILKRIEVDVTRIGDAVAPAIAGKTIDSELIVQPTEIELRQELAARSGYRIHSAEHKGKRVMVMVFEGSQAKKDRDRALSCRTRIFHPNLPQIIGVSPDSVSYSPYIMLRGDYDRKAQYVIGSALMTMDTSKSLKLISELLASVAAGLDYLRSQDVTSERSSSLHRIDEYDLDVFSNAEGRIYISINPAYFEYGVDPLLNEFPNELSAEERTLNAPIWNRFNALTRLLLYRANGISYDKYGDQDGHFVIFDYRLPRAIRSSQALPLLDVAPEVALRMRFKGGNNMFGKPRSLSEISDGYRAKVDLISHSEKLAILEVAHGRLKEQSRNTVMSLEPQYLAIASQWRPEPDLRCGCWYEEDQPETYTPISEESRIWTFAGSSPSS